jgi:NADH:ubiquinone oxidoreductase subunit 2 (subunit N)
MFLKIIVVVSSVLGLIFYFSAIRIMMSLTWKVP